MCPAWDSGRPRDLVRRGLEESVTPMNEIRTYLYILKKPKRAPNDQRSDSMNPNNPMSRDYVAKLRRLTEQAEELEERFKVFDHMSDRFDRLRRQFDRLKTRFREREPR